MGGTRARRETVKFSSSILRRDWTYTVFLPRGYDDTSACFPLVFLLHGYGGSSRLQDMSPDAMLEWLDDGRIPPAILVGPDGFDSWFLNFRESISDAFLTDLFADVHGRFRIAAGAKSTTLCGFSMGGYAGIRFLLLRPDLFGAAALVSPATYYPQPPPGSGARESHVFGRPFSPELWTERNYPALLPTYLESSLARPVWIAAGREDKHVRRGAYRLAARLAKGRKPVSLLTYSGGHVAPPWIYLSALQFLLQRG